jgi:hypothetical protein
MTLPVINLVGTETIVTDVKAFSKPLARLGNGPAVADFDPLVRRTRVCAHQEAATIGLNSFDDALRNKDFVLLSGGQVFRLGLNDQCAKLAISDCKVALAAASEKNIPLVNRVTHVGAMAESTNLPTATGDKVVVFYDGTRPFGEGPTEPQNHDISRNASPSVPSKRPVSFRHGDSEANRPTFTQEQIK